MQIFKSYLKLFLTFPFFIIRDNIGKSILILIAVISYQFLGTFEDAKYEAPIIQTINTNNQLLKSLTPVANQFLSKEGRWSCSMQNLARWKSSGQLHFQNEKKSGRC